MLQHVPRLRAAALVMGLLAAARPAAALLDPLEAEANAALATSVATPAALKRDEPRKLAAQGALALARGETEAAVLHLLRARPGVADCTLQALLASLNSGEPCAGAVWSPLPPSDATDGQALAARIVGARHGESGQAFFAAITVAAVQAAAGGGLPEVRSGSDRFLVRAGAVLEGTWFLDDRVLVVARPGTGGADAARAALDRLALARPEQVLGGPALDGDFVVGSAPLPARASSAPVVARAPAGGGIEPAVPDAAPVSRHHVDGAGFALDVPADAGVTAGPDGVVTFSFAGGRLLVRASTMAPSRNARSTIARRKPKDADVSRQAEGSTDFVPPDMSVVSTAGTTLEGGLTAELLELETPDGRLAALRRSVRARGRTIELLALHDGPAATPPQWAVTAARTLSSAAR